MRTLILISIVGLVLSGCGLTGYGLRGSLQSTKPVYHTVKQGDSLQAIAARYATSVEQVALLNGLRDPNSLASGLRLLIGYRSSNSPLIASTPAVITGSLSGNSMEFESGKLHWPLVGGKFVSGFGPRGGRYHDGIDIAAPIGTPVLAAHSGRVAYSDDKLSGYGNLVIIKGDDGYTTVYAHHRRNLVDKGERVQRGQKIAEVGVTGRSSGPHLHFEVRAKNAAGNYFAVDPRAFFQPAGLRRAKSRRNEGLTPIIAGPRR